MNVLPNRLSGANVKVAMVDTRVDYTHSDLAGNYAGGRDFANSDDDPMDDNGHGTHCAGIVAAMDDGTGLIQVAPKARLYALKVLNAAGSGAYSGIAAALDWCVANRIRVASMSLGGTSESQTLHTACDKAYAAGVLLVAAAGSSGNGKGTGDNVLYPARYDSVIAVAAIDNLDRRGAFPSTGPAVELAMGTGNGMSATTVGSRLDTTATDRGAVGKDTQFGYGMMNAEAATGL